MALDYITESRGGGDPHAEYVERLESRQFSAQSDAFFVDCGSTYEGAWKAGVIEGAGKATYANGMV